MRFTGNIEAKVDAKGRVFLPAVFRKTLIAAQEEQLYLRKDDYACCLTIFPGSVWNKRIDDMRSKLNLWNPEHAQVFRQYLMNAEELQLDGNGRFIIPKRYMDMVEIQQQVSFIGTDETIELWSTEKAQEQQMPQEEYMKSLQAFMMGE
ncbi:MAG: division/cell wall cluster transcriptional repressor MraZ [Bacteroidaceae bacterium]|nr:division/cell wall cluster transcriptional repressor MraZ [Bacteroidaceae bacterium]